MSVLASAPPSPPTNTTNICHEEFNGSFDGEGNRTVMGHFRPSFCLNSEQVGKALKWK